MYQNRFAARSCLSLWERCPPQGGGEGKKALSVTYGDSSPGGRAKAAGTHVHTLKKEVERIDTDTLQKLFYRHPPKGRLFDAYSSLWAFR